MTTATQSPPQISPLVAQPWEVPEHRVEILSERIHAYVLVIPVINEGERIRRQLQAVAEQHAAIDVIIADGGSTDGSLDLDFLRSVGVRALLTKLGPGKLSAQLRMAYAWCLEQGYAGIVTVDGNGKDGVDAIPRFLTLLRNGCDLVQGSRYLPGGEEINTPLERRIAGKLIHAPLISLAAGFRYTDTTNGFRGYSRKLLLDPRVQPFRHVFDRYNLLFYLSIRAPQLGLQVTEIPVTRSYPATGKTPTKIGGFRGKFDMLAELAATAAGRFNPPGGRKLPKPDVAASTPNSSAMPAATTGEPRA